MVAVKMPWHRWTAVIGSSGGPEVILGRLQSLVPLLHLFYRLAEVGWRLGNRGIASSATNDPCMLKEFPGRDPKVGILLETLHQEVTRSLVEACVSIEFYLPSRIYGCLPVRHPRAAVGGRR